MPEKPRWLLAIPDAISQLEQLDRRLLTKRDIERLFGASARCTSPRSCRPSAPNSSATRGCSRGRGSCSTSRSTAAGPRSASKEKRRARLVAELQPARLTGFRFKVPAETMSAKLADLPDGVLVERGRIAARFDGAEDALPRLYALAQQALWNGAFQAFVGR